MKTLLQVATAEGPSTAGRPGDAFEGADSTTASLLFANSAAIGRTQLDKINVCMAAGQAGNCLASEQ